MDWSLPPVMSKAHEVVQASMKSSPQQFVCVRCRMRGELKDMFGAVRCAAHWEFADSGWIDESRD